MASRNRREGSNFNLQPTSSISLNGQNEPPHVHDGGSEQKTGHDAVSQHHDDSLGKIEVSPKAIAHVASRAAQASYGVVGLASRNARPGWADILRREEEHKGVEVKLSDDRVVIDLYVVIEYGTRISEVARNIMSNAKFAVEQALGVPVVQVNVTVQGIRVSS
jgi:uncharacterized alkaline shock family protein YloU